MKTSLFVLYVAVAVLSGLVALQFHRIDLTRTEARRATCEAWKKFDEVTVAQVKAGEKAAPTLTYYKKHPDELVRVIALDEAYIKVLVPPSYC